MFREKKAEIAFLVLRFSNQRERKTKNATVFDLDVLGHEEC